MDLRSAYPYWLLRHGIINSYPSLHDDITTDVAIIGAGISGALVANELCRAGFAVTVIDRRHAGMGSTAASTALLQYEIDTPLYQLCNLVGEKPAIESYHLCRNAIYDLEKICRPLKEPGLFKKKPSFQFASFRTHVAALEKEYRFRKKAGIDIKLLREKEISSLFGIDKPCGLLSSDGAEADAYRITHSLLSYRIARGLLVYDNTEVTRIDHHRRGVVLTTADHKKIRARKLVIACGYESQQYIPKKVQQLHATYAIASEPDVRRHFWYREALIWETARPYLYLRTTPDHRILAGGKDVKFSNPRRRDALLTQKAADIEKAVMKLMHGVQFRTDFKWAGTFAGTKDGLPYIGSIPQRPHTYFALGFGGNGITFSVIAAQAIRDSLLGRKNRALDLFGFDR